MSTRYFVSFNAIIETPAMGTGMVEGLHYPAVVESKTMNTCIDSDLILDNIIDFRTIEEGIAKQTPNCTNVTIINFQELS